MFDWKKLQRRNVSLTLLSLAALVAMSLSVASAEEARPTDTKLDGRWEIRRMIIDGQELPVQKAPKNDFYFKISGNSWFYYFAADGKRMMIELEVASTPLEGIQQGDFKLRNGMGRGKVCKGIFKHENDTLSLCVTEVLMPQSPRPTQFESEAGTGYHLYEMRRVDESSDERSSLEATTR